MLAALIICVQRPPTQQQQSRETSLGVIALAVFLILGIGISIGMHKSADNFSTNASWVPQSISSPSPTGPTADSTPSPATEVEAAQPPITKTTTAKETSIPASGEAQQAAIRRFPALGIAGSNFNKEFIARYKRYQQDRPAFLQDTSWPIRLAEEVAKAVIPSSTPEKPPTATPARTGRTVTVGGYLASPSEELLDKATRYSVQRDEAALAQLMASGMVISLKAGIPVEIADTKIFSGKLKIRPRGQTIELWTVIEAVKDE